MNKDKKYLRKKISNNQSYYLLPLLKITALGIGGFIIIRQK